MLTSRQVFYISKWFSFFKARQRPIEEGLGWHTVHSVGHYLNQGRVRKGNGGGQGNAFSKNVTACRKAKSIGRAWSRGRFCFLLFF